MSSSFRGDWGLPSWDQLNASMLSIPGLSAEKEHFKVIRDFKVPHLKRLLSGISCNAGLNRLSGDEFRIFYLPSKPRQSFFVFNRQFDCRYEAGGCKNDEEDLGPENKGSSFGFRIEGEIYKS